VGIERRRESSTELWDTLTNQGLNGGNQFPNVAGSYSVTELFGETSIPLITGESWAKEVSLELAARYADYSTEQVGGAFSWSSRFNWAPNDAMRFRVTYGEATRAPNIGELFGGLAENFPTGIQDPCDGVTAVSTGELDDECRAIASVAAEIAENGSVAYDQVDYQNINGFDGSNPDLEEETAETFTVGLVFTPDFIEGFTATIDYFNIKVEDAIDVIDRQISINECLRTGAPLFCNNVFRLANSGKINQVDSFLTNVATIRSQGVETQLTYAFNLSEQLGGGDMLIQLNHNYQRRLEKEAFAGGDNINYMNQLDGSTLGRLDAGYRNRASLRTEYDKGPLTVRWTINYLDSIQDFRDEADAPDYDGPGTSRFNSVDEYYYHNLYTSWDVGGDEDFQVYVGVDNVLDSAPPLLPDLTGSNQTGTLTASTFYDAIGRSYYAGFEVKF
jgi:iron complex outermembrane recepter protein